ncbi:hypothetical protein [Novosphingobium cyanobacteriorum]|uniref:Uncharacterized protein n=1 Tax=Novosphingobium cyanobacteriorum TaxID=3024215 RepID=A0ABT6CHX6_9SPHN|nr:hypothetical protein [Novosphingobium cyanobacteriorum]MDF8333417.1 hypothetical protein [Novosphingobium cyanobacteriorum]
MKGLKLKMTDQNRQIVFDDDNPEWTEADLLRALRGDDIPAGIREAFANDRPPGNDRQT